MKDGAWHRRGPRHGPVVVVQDAKVGPEPGQEMPWPIFIDQEGHQAPGRQGHEDKAKERHHCINSAFRRPLIRLTAVALGLSDISSSARALSSSATVMLAKLFFNSRVVIWE